MEVVYFRIGHTDGWSNLALHYLRKSKLPIVHLLVSKKDNPIQAQAAGP